MPYSTFSRPQPSLVSRAKRVWRLERRLALETPPQVEPCAGPLARAAVRRSRFLDARISVVIRQRYHSGARREVSDGTPRAAAGFVARAARGTAGPAAQPTQEAQAGGRADGGHLRGAVQRGQLRRAPAVRPGQGEVVSHVPGPAERHTLARHLRAGAGLAGGVAFPGAVHPLGAVAVERTFPSTWPSTGRRCGGAWTGRTGGGRCTW